ncbi:MAG: ATP synthase F1 subunit gamma [Proteobacteria bacterium]|nr:ATP synthase F1 subunit gamma [Pseudomonadota bacterium]
MASLREIRRKIKSVKSTQQITRAMKMVAAARMRRAQNAILASRPFAVHMEAAVRDLALLEVEADIQAGREVHIHPFFETRPEGRACLVLVTGDKGLCGAFNANAIRAGLEWIRKNKDRRPVVCVVGRKAREVLHRLKDVELETAAELAGIFPKVTFAHAELLGKAVTEAFLDKDCATVDLVYNEFKSVVAQRVVTQRLLPIPVPEDADPDSVNAQGFKFEPDRESVMNALMPRYVKAQLYRVLLESQAAELAARMNAMDAASKNAGDLIGSLTLGLNRTRQGIITREIAELVGGAEALAS